MMYVLLLLCLFSSCTESDAGRKRTIRESLDLWTYGVMGVMLFDSVRVEDLRGVHIAGAGMLNRDILVSGTVLAVGDSRTFVIITDDSARILIDMSTYNAWHDDLELKVGKKVSIHGEVKSGDKGHIYLVANVIRGD